MKNLKWLSLMAAVLLIGSQGYAADDSDDSAGKSSLKVEEVNPNTNKVDGDIDEEITNARMRAESGSKSKWSMSSSVAYTGGSFSRPFGVDRPNIAGLPGQQVATSLGGSLNARYRANKNDSFTLGTSFGVMTPFAGDVGKADKQINIFDPVLGYSRVFATDTGFQNIFDAAVDYATSNESLDVDYLTGPSVSLTSLKTFDKLTAGLSVSVGYNFYTSKAGDNKETADPGFYGGDHRTQWSLGVYPFAEYAFNDTFQFRTVFGWFNYRNLYGDSNKTRLLKVYDYQSVGVGIVASRNVYIYPNVQFVPDNIRSDFTNVSISATINMF